MDFHMHHSMFSISDSIRMAIHEGVPASLGQATWTIRMFCGTGL
jgi:hypothetical protein